MAELSSNVWRIYPGDAPGVIGRQSPPISQLFVDRITWRPDGGSAAGDAVHLKDRKGRTVFFHEAVAGESEFFQEYAAPLQGPFTLESLASGWVEVVLE